MTNPGPEQQDQPPWSGGPGSGNEFIEAGDVPSNVPAVNAFQTGVVHTTRVDIPQGDQQQNVMALVDNDGNPVDPITPVVISPMPADEFRH